MNTELETASKVRGLYCEMTLDFTRHFPFGSVSQEQAVTLSTCSHILAPNIPFRRMGGAGERERRERRGGGLMEGEGGLREGGDEGGGA